MLNESTLQSIIKIIIIRLLYYNIRDIYNMCLHSTVSLKALILYLKKKITGRVAKSARAEVKRDEGGEGE